MKVEVAILGDQGGYRKPQCVFCRKSFDRMVGIRYTPGHDPESARISGICPDCIAQLAEKQAELQLPGQEGLIHLALSIRAPYRGLSTQTAIQAPRTLCGKVTDGRSTTDNPRRATCLDCIAILPTWARSIP